MPLVLNDREVSAIVAALRHWQITTPDDCLFDIACRNGSIEPLDNQEISELAEKLLPEGPR